MKYCIAFIVRSVGLIVDYLCAVTIFFKISFEVSYASMCAFIPVAMEP